MKSILTTVFVILAFNLILFAQNPIQDTTTFYGKGEVLCQLHTKNIDSIIFKGKSATSLVDTMCIYNAGKVYCTFSLADYDSISFSTDSLHVIVIPDSVLDNIYYNQTSYLNPTKFIYPNLKRVNGYVYFNQTNNLVKVEFPLLDTISSYLYIDDNLSLEMFSAPKLVSVTDYVYVRLNSVLYSLSICNIRNIYCSGSGQEPNFTVSGNSVFLNTTQPCFSATLRGTSLTTDSVRIFSNNTAKVKGLIINDCGTSSYGFCWSKAPNPTTADFTLDAKWKKDTIFADLTQLDSNTTYYVRAYSGAVYSNEVSFKTKLYPDSLQTVIIPDSVLNNVYYHQTSYLNPTKLIFPYLKRVDGGIYFHQTNNLIKVEFPLLDTISSYVYINGNLSLRNFFAPKLVSVTDYVYVKLNSLLDTLSICNIRNIYCSGSGQEPYFTISGNNRLLDSIQPCFSAILHSTSLIADSVSVFSRNTAKVKGIITNDCGASSYGFCWSKVPNPTIADFTIDATRNHDTILADLTQLDSNTIYYIRAYSGTVYSNEVSFKTKLYSGDLQVVFMTDSVLNSVYYHQTSYLNPTKLIFPYLKRVDGGIYFHQTNNLIKVEFPLLDTISSYLYINGNLSLENFSAPKLKSVTDYVYVKLNSQLDTLSICNIKNIYCSGSGQEPYFTISGNNSLLDNSQPCFSAALRGTSLTTDNVNTFSKNTAKATGVITHDCGASYGFCWSTTPNPTTADFTVNAAMSGKTISGNLTGLNPNTTYYVRSFSGSIYGNEVSFTTNP